MVSRQVESALVTGGSGYIGSLMTDYLDRFLGLPRVRSYGSADLDVCDRGAVADQLDSDRPRVVFHAAAKAGTDWCEAHYSEAWSVNVGGTVNVVEECLSRDIQVVYLSSACLYPDNRRHYRETDELKALCSYTETKLLAERALEPYADQILTIRMRQPFSNHRHPRNLLEKLAGYELFIDEANSMSHLEECIPLIWDLVVRGTTGPLNMTNPGATTPLRIARMIKRYWRPKMKIGEISYEGLLAMVKAPRVNALVNCSKLESLGYSLMPVEDAIVDCLKNPCDLGEYDWTRSQP